MNRLTNFGLTICVVTCLGTGSANSAACDDALIATLLNISAANQKMAERARSLEGSAKKYCMFSIKEGIPMLKRQVHEIESYLTCPGFEAIAAETIDGLNPIIASEKKKAKAACAKAGM
ncbi:MAG: hypothetical protein ABI705_09040 [Aestuariivirga sp.]